MAYKPITQEWGQWPRQSHFTWNKLRKYTTAEEIVELRGRYKYL